jgi:hypothetical protein
MDEDGHIGWGGYKNVISVENTTFASSVQLELIRGNSSKRQNLYIPLSQMS